MSRVGTFELIASVGLDVESEIKLPNNREGTSLYFSSMISVVRALCVRDSRNTGIQSLLSYTVRLQT